MILLRRINGSSMSPALEDGDIVVALKRKPDVGQVAIISRPDMEVVKRVSEVKGARYYVRGDNPDESTDSRHFGYVKPKDILGTIVIVLPRAISPPAPLKPVGIWFGRFAAALLVTMALAHLYRIDTFIPLLDQALPSGSGFATFAALTIILSEVFAVPFALRMKLSPLAHVLSGALVVFAPIWWIAIGIMTIGTSYGTAQLGEFVNVPSTAGLLVANVAWAVFAYMTLYLLGYDNLRFRTALSKK